MKSLLLFSIFILFTNIIIAVPIDTGMIEWSQPNEITFTAQMIGDEFSFKFTTDDGYEIREGTDGWFYYAVLDENDNIVPSQSKVGIDDPPAESYRLELPGYKLAEIENYRQQFNQQLLEAEEWFRQKRIEANGGTVTLKIGVILVDFADDVHYRGGNFPNGYPRHYFNELIFSQNFYIGEPIPPNFTTPHPENKSVYGSLRDYYNQQSRGKLDIIGKDGIYPEILNPPDPLHYEVPDWVYLDETKEYWEGLPIGQNFWSEAIQKFQIKFPNINLSIYDRYIFIYAGRVRGNALWPIAGENLGYQMGEQSLLSPGTSVFSHIGTHAHEFGHLLGAEDEYNGIHSGGSFDLMSNGSNRGPEVSGECPAGINPFYRIKWEWNNVTYLNENSYADFLLAYNYQNPNYYRLDNPYDDTEYFLIENRLREGFDKYTPNDPNYVVNDPKDLNGNLGGLLIWTIDEDNPIAQSDKTGLKLASDNDLLNNRASVPFPYNNNPSGLNLTHNTTPNNSIRNISDPGVLIENIRWITPANNILVNISHDFSANYTVISSNQTWNNTRIFDKDLLILGNVTLTLQEGAVLKFYPQKKLQVLNTGILNIESSGNPVELTNNTPAQKWNGIELNGLSSVLQGSNCIISNTNQAIKIHNSRNISFSNIRFENNINTLSISPGPTNPYQVDLIKCKLINSPVNLLNTNIVVLTMSIKNCFVENSSISTQVNINLTLVNNDFKSNSNITLSPTNNNIIKNNIFYNSIINNPVGSSLITYNCIFPYPQNPNLFTQAGNFSAEPQFLTGGNGSQLFEYSPCIDVGDPSSEYGNEPGNNGGRINIGSLGNTSAATQVNPLVPQLLSGGNVTFLGNYIFNTNSYWNINNTTTLLSNAQLLINPGVKLNFNNATSLMVNGTLSAQGIETNNITFDKIGPSGTWGNIVFSGTGSSNSMLDYVEIKYATDIRCLNNANVTIQNSIIDHCTQGVYIYNSQPQIINNQIIEPVQNGINGDASGLSPIIQHNTIIKSSSNSQYKQYQGIILSNFTNGYIAQNDIAGFYWGMYIGGGSDAYFTNYAHQTFTQNNRVRDNRYGICAGWGGFIFAGMWKSYAQNNSIYNNSSFDAKSYQNSNIYAECNWWGNDGAQISVDGTSTLDVSFPLTSDPWLSQQKSGIDFISYDYNYPIEGVVLNPDSIVFVGILLEMQERIQEAVLLYKQMISNNTHPGFALGRLVGIKNRYHISNIRDYLETLLTKERPYKPVVLNLIAGILIGEDKYEEAIILYNRIINRYPNTYYAVNALFEKFFATLNYKHNLQLAEQLLEELHSLNLLDEDYLIRLQLAENLFNSSGLGYVLKDNFKNQNNVASEIPERYSLSDNYPNPFNPSTTIRYQLPQDGLVTLKIYDILGKEVKILVNEQKSTGRYEVRFDASDLASGVYIYRIQSGSFINSKKMMLLK